MAFSARPSRRSLQAGPGAARLQRPRRQTVTQPHAGQDQASGQRCAGRARDLAAHGLRAGRQRKSTWATTWSCASACSKEIVPQAKLEYMAVTAQNTLPLVQNGTLDIGCGPTTNNTARQQQVAFAVTTYVSEVRMAVRKDSDLKSISQLGRPHHCGVHRHHRRATAAQAERTLRRAIKTVLGKDHHESFMLLESGRADAFVLDDNLLAGMIANSKDPSAYRIVGEPLGGRGRLRCCSAKDDPPTFKAAVDGVLTKLMQSGEMEKIYTKWFVNPIPPKNMSLNLPLGTTLRQLFAAPNDKPLETYQQ